MSKPLFTSEDFNTLYNSMDCEPAARIANEKTKDLQAKNEKYVEALKFYAAGNNDLEPIESKKHLYAKKFSMDSPEWRKRSMSDYITGKLARQILKECDAL